MDRGRVGNGQVVTGEWNRREFVEKT